MKIINLLDNIVIRLFCILIILIVIFLNISPDNIDSYRQMFSKALLDISLLFTIIATLSLTNINNYVKGLNNKYYNTILRIREQAKECYFYLEKSNKNNFINIRDNIILPLLEKRTEDWSKSETFKNWNKRFQSIILQPDKELYKLICIYLLSIEDEINQLAILFVRRVAAIAYYKTFKDSYILICLTVVIIILNNILPLTLSYNFILIMTSSIIMIYAIFALLRVLSFTMKEIKEEALGE